MAKSSFVILSVFLILCAVPANSQDVTCTSNASFLCTNATLLYFPPDPSGYSMIQVMGWVYSSVTVMQVGVQLYDVNNDILYSWQLSLANTVYKIASQPQQFFYAPWFTLTGRVASTYDAKFGMFNQFGSLIYELPFSFVLT